MQMNYDHLRLLRLMCRPNDPSLLASRLAQTQAVTCRLRTLLHFSLHLADRFADLEHEVNPSQKPSAVALLQARNLRPMVESSTRTTNVYA